MMLTAEAANSLSGALTVLKGGAVYDARKSSYPKIAT